jgi:hypothetical protein
LRISGYHYLTVYVPDWERGYALLPGAEGWWRSEGEAYIHINSQGLRDHDHTLAKPTGVYRIAILGDSFAEALQVPLEQTFWHLLETQLNDQGCVGDKTAEVINFGVGGYGTGQQLLTLRQQVWPYQPDLVLLAFFLGNDVQNNAFALEQNSEYPYFVQQDDRLVPDPDFPQHRNFAARYTFAYGSKHLRLLGLLQQFKQARRVDPTTGLPISLMGPEVGLNNGIYQPPADADWREAWQITENLLRTVRDEVAAQQADLLVISFSSAIVVHPSPEVREQFEQHLQTVDVFYASRRLESFALREAMPLISLSEPFQQYAKTNQVYLHGFANTRLGEGHWNIQGHQLAAKLIAPALCSGYPLQK